MVKKGLMNMREKDRLKKMRRVFIWNIAVFLLLGSLYMTKSDVKATSATLTFSAESREVQVGETFSVVVYLEANDNIGSFETNIAYDDSLVAFEKGGSYVSGGDGELTISDVDSEASSSKKYSINFKALKEGTCNFGTSGAPKVYNEDGDELSVSSNRLNVTATTTTKLSDNCNLKRLLISPGTLNDPYSNGETNYETEVSYDSDMLFVVAEAEDSDAEVSIQGNENLEVGTNFVHVIVTAESGEQKDVKIKVKRLAEGEMADGNEDEPGDTEKPDETEDGINVSVEEDVITIQTGNTYTVASLENEDLIPEGYEKSEITIGTEKVTAYISSKNQAGEFVLLYLKNSDEEAGFYQYDRVEKTIQRYVDGNMVPSLDLGGESSQEKANVTAVIAVFILGMLLIVLSIILVVMRMKWKKERAEFLSGESDENFIDR